MGRKVTRGNFAKDPYYPRVAAAVEAVLGKQDYVAPVDLFVAMGLLEKQHLEDWRFGRVPYLEKVITCNLAKTARILRLLALHAEAQGLKPSGTVYKKWGRGAKAPLRFSKFGDRHLEEAYARHFVRPRAPTPSVE